MPGEERKCTPLLLLRFLCGVCLCLVLLAKVTQGRLVYSLRNAVYLFRVTTKASCFFKLGPFHFNGSVMFSRLCASFKGSVNLWPKSHIVCKVSGIKI